MYIVIFLIVLFIAYVCSQITDNLPDDLDFEDQRKASRIDTLSLVLYGLAVVILYISNPTQADFDEYLKQSLIENAPYMIEEEKVAASAELEYILSQPMKQKNYYLASEFFLVDSTRDRTIFIGVLGYFIKWPF